jgi:flagellar assembly protein FliH
VAVAVASKLAPALIAREPLAEVSALANECFHQLVATPHVEVRVGAAIYETAKSQIDNIVQSRGFEGRLAVVPDETIAPGDCRIEWADGGVIRNEAVTMAAIDEMVARYISARTAPAP